MIARLRQFGAGPTVKKGLNLLFVAISALSIGLAVYKNWDTLRASEWHIRPLFILPTLLCMSLTLLAGGYAWHTVVRAVANFDHWRLNLKYWGYSNFAKRLPSPAWYIASRSLLYEKHGISKRTIVLISTVELIAATVAGILLSILFLPLTLSQMPALVGDRWWVLFPLLLISLALIHPAVLQAILRRLAPDGPSHPFDLWHTAHWIGAFTLVWFAGAFTLYFLVNVFYPLPMSQFSTLFTIWVVANVLSMMGSISAFSFGVRDISLSLLLIPLTNPAVAVISMLILRILWLSAESIGGLLTLLLKEA